MPPLPSAGRETGTDASLGAPQNAGLDPLNRQRRQRALLKLGEQPGVPLTSPLRRLPAPGATLPLFPMCPPPQFHAGQGRRASEPPELLMQSACSVQQAPAASPPARSRWIFCALLLLSGSGGACLKYST